MNVRGHEAVAKLNGNPLRAVKIPEISQPPMIVFTQPGALPAIMRPRPIGSSQIPLTFNR